MPPLAHLMAYESWMDLALAQAALGATAGEVPVGAVLLDSEGAVMASGFNQPVSSHDPTAHAEIVVLRQAALKMANYRLPNTTLIVTVEPCLMCAGALVNARVARVVFGAREPKWGAFGSRLTLDGLGLNHQIEVVSGIREQECGDLLRAFFKARRS
ncbi:MAG: tRNA adenosine(34) deaminase TadA [Vicinamibacteria bacterium]